MKIANRRLMWIEPAAAVVALVMAAFGLDQWTTSGDRVPLNERDKQVIAALGGLGGPWLRPVSEIIRVDRDPPPGANYAKAPCPHFVIYRTTHELSLHQLAALFVHEGQHIKDGCHSGALWEARANDAARCWRRGVSRDRCVIRRLLD